MLQVANAMVGSWAGPPAMMNIFHKMFGSHSCPTIIQQNNFSNFQHYFIQKVGSLLRWTFRLFVVSFVQVCHVACCITHGSVTTDGFLAITLSSVLNGSGVLFCASLSIYRVGQKTGLFVEVCNYRLC